MIAVFCECVPWEGAIGVSCRRALGRCVLHLRLLLSVRMAIASTEPIVSEKAEQVPKKGRGVTCFDGRGRVGHVSATYARAQC